MTLEELRAFRHQRKSPWAMIFLGCGLILLSLAVFMLMPKDESAQAALSQGFSVTPMEVNYPAPTVTLTDLQGQPVALTDYHGQVVLYNAWATWCPPCKEEMPTLQAYYEAHKDKGFVVIAIEDGQPVDEVAAYVQEQGLTFPVWPDLEYKATIAFRTNSLPASFVIDRAGTVRLTWLGAISRDALEKHVTPLLER